MNAEAEALTEEDGDGTIIDLNEVEDDAGFEVMPSGMYDCVVESLEFEHSQSKGNPMWSWVLEITEGEYAGRKLFFHTVFKGPGLPITKKAISRVAPELMSGPFNPEDEESIDQVLGKNCRARVNQRKYQGEMRNNVRELFGPGEGSDF